MKLLIKSENINQVYEGYCEELFERISPER